MANDTQSGRSSGGKLDSGEGASNSGAKKVDTLGLRRSKRDSSSGQITVSPSSTRRSERLEKRTPSESPLVPRKSKRLEQQNTPSPLRRSDRSRTPGSSPHFGLKSSQKGPTSVEVQKKKEKKQRSVEQLNMEAVEVSLGENHDHEAVSLKRKKLTARRYKALFTKQRKSVSEQDSDDKLERPDLLPQIHSLDGWESGSQPVEHRENGSLGCGLSVIEPSLEGYPSEAATSLKTFNVKVSSNDVASELAHAVQSLPDKPPCPSDGGDLCGSHIGCTNIEIVDNVNKGSNDHCSSGTLQIPELVRSTSTQGGDISLESGNQFMQSEKKSSVLRVAVDVSRIMVNKDASTEVEETAPLATEHENDNLNGNGAVSPDRNFIKLKENFVSHGSKSDSSKFVEYWVPVPFSNLQLEQYCATLINNAITLCSPLKKDDVGALQDILMTVRKCCNHPYIVDPSLQPSITKGLPEHENLNVGIKASGKLELLDMILSKIQRQKLKVLILFQTVAGSGGISIGDILDDFLRKRFGVNSYERIDAILPPAKKQDALNKFNKGGEQFVLLLEHRACSSSIKLSSVDIVIIFDTEFHPSNDIKVLQRISIDPQSEQIKVFRLYCCYTFEEKVLMLVKQKHQKNVHNNLQNVNRTINDLLLMWGASVLFDRLDKYHAAQSTMSSADISSGQQWLLDDIVKNFTAKILNNSKNNCEHDSIISRAFISEGVYHIDGLLLGEREIQLTDGEDRQMFWKTLFDGRYPCWKFLGEPTPRSRKRVLYDENDETATKHQKVVETRDTAPAFQPKLKGRGQPVISKAATNESESLPVSVACTLDEANKDTNLLPCKDSLSHESHLAHREPMMPSDELRSLHAFLRVEMEKLLIVLKLSVDIKHMVKAFLEFVMKNHRVSKEPASILQAFQISLCWIAASILKEKIDKGNSLMLAKKVLNFQCTQEEAHSVYKKLRSLKKTFVQHPRSISVLIPSQNVSLAPENIREQPPFAECPSSASFDLRTVTVEVEENSSSLEPLEEHTLDEVNGNYADRKLKKLQKKCDAYIFQLHKQHEKQILKFHKMREQEKLQIEDEHQLESALIRTTYPENAMKMDQLEILDKTFKKKIQAHEMLMEMDLKNLQARHSAETEQTKKKIDDWLAQMMGCISSLGPEKEVPKAGPDVVEQNPDRIVHNSGTRNVIFSDISVNVGDVAVGSVLPETSFHTPVNPFLNDPLEIEQADVASFTVVEPPKETSQSTHQIRTTIMEAAVACSLHAETSPILLNSTSGMVLDTVIETSPVVGAEQLKELHCLPHIDKDITSHVRCHDRDKTGSIDLATSKEHNAYENLSSSENNEILSGVPCTVGSEIPSALTLEVDTSLELETEDGGGNSVGSDTTGNQKDLADRSISDTVPSPKLPSADVLSMPITPTKELPQECVCQNTGQLQPTSDCSPHDCSQMVEGDAELAFCNNGEAVVLPPSTEGMDSGHIHDGHIEGSNSLLDSAASLQMVEGFLEHQAVSQNGETVVLPASVEGMDSVHSPNRQIEGSNSLSNSVASLQMFEGSVELSHHCVSQNGEAIVLSPSTECLDSVRVHDGHVDGGKSSSTSAAALQMVEGSGDLSHQAVSRFRETLVLPPTEGMDLGNLSDSHVEGRNSLPTAATSSQIVEGFVELSHQGVSQNDETIVLPPLTEGLDSVHVHDSHIEGGKSSTTSAAALQRIEGSGDFLLQAVSKNSETMVLPSTEGMDLGNFANSHDKESNSLPSAVASPQMVEGPVGLSHQAISLNGEITGLRPSTESMGSGNLSNIHVEGSNFLLTDVASPQMVEESVGLSRQAISLDGEIMGLPPSTEAIGSNNRDNRFDLEIGNVTDRGLNIEPSTASLNPLAPMQLVENIIRPLNQALLPAEPNLAIAEAPTRLPVHQMHCTGYRNPTLSSRAEPLQIELEKMREVMERKAKLYDSIKSRLNSECEKEMEETIAQIRCKYDSKLKEAESAFLLEKTELDLNHKRVYMNYILADAFRSKCLDVRMPGNFATKQATPSGFIQHMHQLSLQPRLRHPSAATLSSAGQPTAVSQSFHRSPGLSASAPARPPQISAITGGEIRSQIPHLHPFRPPSCTSAASISSIPCNIPIQQLPTSLPSTSLSPPSLLAQRPSPSLPSQFLLKPNSLSQPPAVHPVGGTNQDVSGNQTSETQNGVQPGRLNLTLSASAVGLLMDVDDQARSHLPNILQHLAGSGLNTNASDPSVTRASCNANQDPKTSATASDVVCLSDNDG